MKIRTKRHICLVVSGIGFLTMLGAVGGIECNTLNLKAGVIIAVIGLMVFAAFAYKGGYMK